MVQTFSLISVSAHTPKYIYSKTKKYDSQRRQIQTRFDLSQINFNIVNTTICSNLTHRLFHLQNIECNLLDVTWEPLKLFSFNDFFFVFIIAFDILSTRKTSQPQTMLRPAITHGINNLGLQWFLCCRYELFNYLFHSHNIELNYYQKNNCGTIGL